LVFPSLALVESEWLVLLFILLYLNLHLYVGDSFIYPVLAFAFILAFGQLHFFTLVKFLNDFAGNVTFKISKNQWQDQQNKFMPRKNCLINPCKTFLTTYLRAHGGVMCLLSPVHHMCSENLMISGH